LSPYKNDYLCSKKFTIMKKTFLFTIFISLGVLAGIKASEPVTKTQFFSVYGNLAEIDYVQNHGAIEREVILFLTDTENPIDQKAAVINTLLVNNQNRNNAETFTMMVARLHRENFQNLDLNKLTGEQLFCLGYLTLVDEDGVTANALPILEMARSKDPGSSTIALIYAMTSAQASAEAGDHCKGWDLFNQVLEDASLNGDMNREMVSILTSGMQPLSEGCE
jgi:hypothetical protein